MKKITVFAFFIAFMLAGFLVPVPASGQFLNEPWGIYEDWSSGIIRSEYWIGRNDPGLEVKREIQRGFAPGFFHFPWNTLVMRYRMSGSNSSTGYIDGANRMLAKKAAQINQFSAYFKIRKYTIKGISDDSRTRIRPAIITLQTFNDGSSTGTGDMTGDYALRIVVNRNWNSPDPVGDFRIDAFIFRCPDSVCSASPTPPVITIPNISTVKVGTWFSLRAVWDAPNDRFLVGVNNEPDVVLSYSSGLNVKAAGQPAADVRMQVRAADRNGQFAEGDVETEVGLIRTNQSALLP